MTVDQLHEIAGPPRIVRGNRFARAIRHGNSSAHFASYVTKSPRGALLGVLAVSLIVGAWLVDAGSLRKAIPSWHTKAMIEYVHVADPKQTALIEELKQRLDEARRRIDWLNSQLKDPPIRTNESRMESVSFCTGANSRCIYGRSRS